MDLLNFSAAKLKSLPRNELAGLAAEIRAFLIENNSDTGGHIGANLGAVELSIALHRVFESPKDYIFFDTGHIGYTHKIITGRAELFSSLNTFGGMNRFITPDESEHDIVEVSHAGTAPSLGLGAALAKKQKDDLTFNIAVIGDGSLAEGVALEALNHAAVEEVNLLIIVNDNGYAISPGYGAIYEDFKRTAERGGRSDFLTGFGFSTTDVLDGHCIDTIVANLEEYKRVGGVKVLHVKTEKGRGFPAAEQHPIRMHFSMPYDKETGVPKTQTNERQIQAFATDALMEKMAVDPNVVAITPSTKYATDLDRVAAKFPERVIDPGMSEQHALSMAAGMALTGTKPVVFFQSTFMQRAFDQIVHDIAFSNLDVLMVASRSGFAGYDNSTHHGILDYGYLKCVPNLRIVYPQNCERLYEIMSDELDRFEGPTLVLFPYGFESEYQSTAISLEKEAEDSLGIITLGNTLARGNHLSKLLSQDEVVAETYCFESLKPLPSEHLDSILKKHKRIISIEEYILNGGLNESLSAEIVKRGLSTKYRPYGLECKFYPGGTAVELAEFSGLNVKTIYRSVSEWLKSA